nr:MAG TPA: hypothetical protein [Caudoviricetes sp.]
MKLATAQEPPWYFQLSGFPAEFRKETFSPAVLSSAGTCAIP